MPWGMLTENTTWTITNLLMIAPDLMSSLSTKPTKFLGSFVTSNPYRGKLGPKLDEAWMRWHEFRKSNRAQMASVVS